MSVTFPNELLRQTHMTNEEMAIETAVHLFEIGRLSFGQAAELAGMARWPFQQLLASRQIPLHYTEKELEDDLHTVELLEARP